MEINTNATESLADFIKAMEEGRKKDIIERLFDWLFRAAIGFLIWYSVKMVDKVEQSTIQMSTMSNQIEIVKHDMEYMRRDISKLESSFDKLSDKK